MAAATPPTITQPTLYSPKSRSGASIMLLSGGICRIGYSGGGAKLCDTFDETVEFANPRLGSQSEVFERECEIDTERSGARGCRTRRWVEEILFDVSTHANPSISPTQRDSARTLWSGRWVVGGFIG